MCRHTGCEIYIYIYIYIYTYIYILLSCTETGNWTVKLLRKMAEYEQRGRYFEILTLRLLMSHIYIYIERLFLMFLTHTQRRSTIGRTPLDE